MPLKLHNHKTLLNKHLNEFKIRIKIKYISYFESFILSASWDRNTISAQEIIL
jgi:hypothetical protein